MWQSIEEMFAGDLRLRLTASAAGIRAIEFEPFAPAGTAPNAGNPLLAEVARQLHAYFEGQLRRFDLPLDLAGTEFQRRVWLELTRIPYGETRSYQQMACAIGSPKAVRALGATTFMDEAEFQPQRSQRFRYNETTVPQLACQAAAH